MQVHVRRFAALVLMLLAVWGLYTALPTDELRDYGSFLASGRAAATGENPYGIHPMTFHVVLPGIDLWNPNLNPPVSVPLFTLLDALEPHRSFRFWWSLSFWCYLCTLALLVRRYGAGPNWLLALWTLALAGVWDTLALGQIYLPLVLAAVGSWLLLERGRTTSAGVLLGILVAVKPNFAVWPMLLVLAAHYRAPLVAGATAVLLMLVPIAMHGTVIYRQWIELIVTDTNRSAFLTNVSLPGLAQRMDAGLAGVTLSVALLIGLSASVYRHKPSPLRVSALGILGSLLASPIAWIHYTLFLLPVFFTTRLSRPMLAAAALLVVPVPFLLKFIGTAPWVQLTIGSVYNWAVLLCLVGYMLNDRTRPISADDPAPEPPAKMPVGIAWIP
jgi:hypothetical protein